VRPEVRLAHRGDVDGLVALENRYFIGNLDPAEHADGFISVLHSPGWFARAIDDGGVHVAVTPGGEVVGFIALTAPPDPAAPGLSPIVRTMLELAETLEFHGAPVASQRYAVRGPVCIAAEARGLGVYSTFNAATREAYRERYDLGVLFVGANNPRSLHTTTAKLGARVLTEFEADGKRFHFLAFAFGDGGDVTGDRHPWPQR
jgi:hypothetical protein